MSISMMVFMQFPDRDFNRDLWNAHPEKRYEMAIYLNDSGVLLNKSHEELIQMLGEPESFSTSEILCFTLGIRPGFFIDPDLLKVYLEQGKVREVKIFCEGKGECEY